ncbi:hypothetical protein HPB49_024184 [Dermacentor silvarum]|uniref:Uncharacterized protein n=1 Tax=Dermacentor silvarum TaxID=543639 RepID=A0ACB8DH12_DERSI|nr:hypothetical protein HPB49_024184 [Dermacentor silvarum]
MLVPSFRHEARSFLAVTPPSSPLLSRMPTKQAFIRILDLPQSRIAFAAHLYRISSLGVQKAQVGLRSTAPCKGSPLLFVIIVKPRRASVSTWYRSAPPIFPCVTRGHRDGLVVFSEERDDTGAAESPWPIFKNVVCGVAVTALGALTLGAFLTSKS